MLDLDPGQPEWGVPGTVSLWSVRDAVAPASPPCLTAACTRGDPGAPQLVAARWVGLVTVDTHPQLYSAAVESLAGVLAASLARAPSPVVVNTHGWVRGPGMLSLERALLAVGPSVVVAVEGVAKSKQLMSFAPRSLRDAHAGGYCTVVSVPAWDAAAAVRPPPEAHRHQKRGPGSRPDDASSPAKRACGGEDDTDDDDAAPATPVPPPAAKAAAPTPSEANSASAAALGTPSGRAAAGPSFLDGSGPGAAAASTTPAALGKARTTVLRRCTGGSAAASRHAAGTSGSRAARHARLAEHLCRGGFGPAAARAVPDSWHPRGGPGGARWTLRAAGSVVVPLPADGTVPVMEAGHGILWPELGRGDGAADGDDAAAVLHGALVALVGRDDGPEPRRTRGRSSAAAAAVVALAADAPFLGYAVPNAVLSGGDAASVASRAAAAAGRGLLDVEREAIELACAAPGGAVFAVMWSPVRPEVACSGVFAVGVSATLVLPPALAQGDDAAEEPGVWHAFPRPPDPKDLDHLTLGLAPSLRAAAKPQARKQTHKLARRSGARLPAGASAHRARGSLERKGKKR